MTPIIKRKFVNILCHSRRIIGSILLINGVVHRLSVAFLYYYFVFGYGLIRLITGMPANCVSSTPLWNACTLGCPFLGSIFNENGWLIFFQKLRTWLFAKPLLPRIRPAETLCRPCAGWELTLCGGGEAEGDLVRGALCKIAVGTLASRTEPV